MDKNVEEYQKELLWRTAAETFYRVAYAESLLTSVVQAWRPVDGFIKSMVTLTTIASVILGWAAWDVPIGEIAGLNTASPYNLNIEKLIWLAVAGTAAFLALLHVILKISDRLTDLSHNLQYFKSLRLNLERFIYEMEIDPDFSLEQFKTTFELYREWLLVGSQMLKDDILLTRKRRTKVQKKLNQQMGDMIL